jgi:hypothetical protein
MEVERELELNEVNLDNNITKERSIEIDRKIWSKKEIEDLLEEMSEEDLKDLETEEDIEEEITEEISRLYLKVCEQEKILFKGKKEMLEIYYDFGKKVEGRLGILLDEEYEEEKTAINRIIEEIIAGGINFKRKSVVRKSAKARKIYKVILAAGGRKIIKRLKKLNSEDYMKFSFKEIEEWVKNR